MSSEVRPPATLRCGGDWVALDDEQFTCLVWMWRAYGKTATPIARMFVAGGRFDHAAVEDIGGFVAEVRARLGDTLAIDSDGRFSQVTTREVVSLLYAHKLAYERMRGGKPVVFRNGKRVPESKKVQAAVLGDLPPLVSLLATLDAFCRRVRENGDPLEVDLRDVYEWI